MGKLREVLLQLRFGMGVWLFTLPSGMCRIPGAPGITALWFAHGICCELLVLFIESLFRGDFGEGISDLWTRSHQAVDQQEIQSDLVHGPF